MSAAVQRALTPSRVAMLEIRMGWCLNGFNGAGLWRPKTAESLVVLAAEVIAANQECGVGTHWIEVRRA